MTVIQILDGAVARYLPSTGLMLVSIGVEPLGRILAAETVDDHERDDALAYLHEIVHHLQALSSAYLWQSAVASVDASFAILSSESPKVRASAMAEIARRERAWGLRACGVSVADLCEGAAVVESYKAYAKTPTVAGFLAMRNRYFPGKGNSVYRRTFDILSDECGQEAAFDLLPVVTFLSLQGDIPGRSFEMLVSDRNIRRGDLVGAPAKTIADALGMRLPVLATASVAELEMMHPQERHPTLFPMLKALIAALGENAQEVFARPHKAFEFPLRDEIIPALTVGAHRQGGSISMPAGVGRTDKGLRRMMVMLSAGVAAARNVALGIETHMPCPHLACPNHACGLCTGYAVPPPDPETCGFRNEVLALGGKEIHEIAAECAPLLDDAILALANSNQRELVFPGSEKMPHVDRREDEKQTRAEHFDQRHLLDPEDNDGLLLLTCKRCGQLWQESVSNRKVQTGFEAKCPSCGRPEYVSRDTIMFSLNLDDDYSEAD